MGYDLFRCLKRLLFWTLENEAGWNVPDGLLKLLAVKGWAHGEQLQTKFPWRAFNSGMEQAASWGLLNHNNRPTRAYAATQQTAALYAQLPALTMDDFPAQVGLAIVTAGTVLLLPVMADDHVFDQRSSIPRESRGAWRVLAASPVQ